MIEASSHHAELSAKEIWNLYMTLGQVGGAFRTLKTDSGVRPLYHQVTGRTKAHLWISVLAYHLLAVAKRQLREHGDTRRWARYLVAIHPACPVWSGRLTGASSFSVDFSRIADLGFFAFSSTAGVGISSSRAYNWKLQFEINKNYRLNPQKTLNI